MNSSPQNLEPVNGSVLDDKIVAFFAENPSIEPYFIHFKNLSFTQFSSLTDAEIKEKIGDIDEDTILKFRGTGAQFPNEEDADLLIAANEGEISKVDDDDVIETGLGVRLVTIKVLRCQSITTCIMEELPKKCESCLHNIAKLTQDHKLCNRLKSSSAQNIPQIKAFPIGKFELIVSDESFMNMLKVKGVVSNNVKKQVGGVIYEFLKSIFP